MKKKQKVYLAVGIGALLVLGLGAGAYFYNKKNQEQSSSSGGVTKVTKVLEGTNGKSATPAKTDNTPVVVTPVQVTPSKTTTNVPTALGTLDEASVTAYLYKFDEVAADGTSVMPAGSIVPTFYTQTGTFTIQKMVDGTWKDIITNYNYPGHGGITAWFAGPTEDNISYRVLQIEGGRPSKASKTFVIRRSDLTTGTHTYN